MVDRVFVLTGARGTGKSTMAGTYLPPDEVDKVFYHDAEDSAVQLVDQMAKHDLAFGYYGQLTKRFSALPDTDLMARIGKGDLPWTTKAQRNALVDYYRYILSDLDDNLTPGKYKVYVHDTLEKLEAGMVAWVEANKKSAGVTSTGFGRLWTEGVYPLYEGLVSAIHARGVETVILCSHLKTPWEGSRPVPGKVAPSGKKLLYRLSSLMIWLVTEPRNADGAPAGLILKERLGEVAPDGTGGWNTRRMLPMRIPHCTWKDIDRYLVEGCNLNEPGPGERMSEGEREMISELLTDEQMRLMVLGAEEDLELLKLESQPILTQTPTDVDSLKRQAKALAAENVTLEAIAEQLGKPVPLIKRWIAE